MKREEIVQLAANGNKHAEAFLRAYAERAHFLDDLVDKPRADFLEVAGSEADWLLVVTANPFFEQYKAALVPIMLASLSAWADSNQMEPGTARDVVKGIWHEVVYVVAFITGGWLHMRRVSAHREYDIEAKEAHGTLRS